MVSAAPVAPVALNVSGESLLSRIRPISSPALADEESVTFRLPIKSPGSVAANTGGSLQMTLTRSESEPLALSTVAGLLPADEKRTLQLGIASVQPRIFLVS